MARRVSLRTIRYGLAGSALALLLLVVGLIGYARYKVHRLMGELPGRLGVHITQESDNVTYSQSYQGRTVYTVHAKKQIQQMDGKYTLRDVGMVLYGAKGDRSDRIRGSEFEYDQKNGVLRAVGEVFLDWGAPGSGGAGAKKAAANDESRMIHVKTSGLTFLQKERSAATDEEVEFTAGGMTGRAVGATYDSGSGVVVLKQDVRMSGLRVGRAGGTGEGTPMVLTAARAEMDRVPAAQAEARGAAAIGLAAAGNGSVVKLEGAKVLETSEHGEETMAAERAVVRLTEDGSPTRVDGEGNVVLTSHGKDGAVGRLTGQRMAVTLNADGQPAEAQLMGDVRFAEDGREARGQAAALRMSFDKVGRPVRAVLTGGVVFDEKAASGTRQLTAETVDVALGGGGRERVVVRGAVASGKDGAKLRLVGAAGVGGKAKAGAVTTTDVQAETLTARMAAVKKGMELTGLDGAGKTEVRQVVRDASGAVDSQQTSTGATLRVDFAAGGKGRQEIARAEQGGGVTVVSGQKAKVVDEGSHVSEARRGAPGSVAGFQETRARGETAVYEAAGDRLLLSGGVQLTDAESALLADRVELQRGTGDATAEGGVKVTYAQAGGRGEAVHVLAGKAVSNKATGVTEFTAGGGRVKMWQGGSQVEARVLDFDRAKKTLVAKDERGTDDAVRVVLVDAQAKKPEVPVRVTSREMRYTDGLRQVEFRGGVRVVDGEGTMRADAATVYLAPAEGRSGANQVSESKTAAGLSLGGKVERIVATGGVEIRQPERVATGERLVYTAADETFVLTGTKAAPPRMSDEARGTITGGALRFKRGEGSVEVTGGEGGRVTTLTKVKQ